MTLGLSRSRLESDIEHELRRLSGMDSQTARKIAEAVAEAIYRNTRRIEQNLQAAGINV
jgi:hypothetical protein